jgi:tetratricopeptide (TPR) repeat protein
MRLSPIPLAALLSLFTLTLNVHSQVDPLRAYTSDTARAAEHASPDWQLVEPHLPDPQTASAAALEMQGDLLRARRFPEDALDYYGYAIKRGGDPAVLLNRIGVTELEIGNSAIARECFKRVVKMRKRDPQGWNNLGAVDFLDRQYMGALRSYKRALRLDRGSAVSHSNLGLTYVQLKDYESARRELAVALKLDPEIFNHSSGSGISLHMLSTEDRADFAFEMAKVYARAGNVAEMLHSLETAAEAGMDVRYRMSADRDLSPYVHDPRLVRLLRVAKSLRSDRKPTVNVADALPAAAAEPVAR